MTPRFETIARKHDGETGVVEALHEFEEIFRRPAPRGRARVGDADLYYYIPAAFQPEALERLRRRSHGDERLAVPAHVGDKQAEQVVIQVNLVPALLDRDGVRRDTPRPAHAVWPAERLIHMLPRMRDPDRNPGKQCAEPEKGRLHVERKKNHVDSPLPQLPEKGELVGERRIVAEEQRLPNEARLSEHKFGAVVVASEHEDFRLWKGFVERADHRRLEDEISQPCVGRHEKPGAFE